MLLTMIEIFLVFIAILLMSPHGIVDCGVHCHYIDIDLYQLSTPAPYSGGVEQWN